MNQNRIEILELPSGRFTWIVHSAGNLVHAGTEHDSTLDAELAAQLYVRMKHSGVDFTVERRKQLDSPA